MLQERQGHNTWGQKQDRKEQEQGRGGSCPQGIAEPLIGTICLILQPDFQADPENIPIRN